MSYTGLGERNNQYAIWDVNVLLPMAGTVVTRVEKEIDNLPDITAAIDMGDHEDGSDVELEEKPQNLVEIKPIQGLESPFLLRLIHLRQNTIPDDIKVGHELRHQIHYTLLITASYVFDYNLVNILNIRSEENMLQEPLLALLAIRERPWFLICMLFGALLTTIIGISKK